MEGACDTFDQVEEKNVELRSVSDSVEAVGEELPQHPARWRCLDSFLSTQDVVQ